MVQGCWWDRSSLFVLPHVDETTMAALASRKLTSLSQLLEECRRQPVQARAALEQALGSTRAAEDCMQVCLHAALFVALLLQQRLCNLPRAPFALAPNPVVCLQRTSFLHLTLLQPTARTSHP
jgi:hypothetical protein